MVSADLRVLCAVYCLIGVDDGTKRLLVVTETGDRGQMVPDPTVATSEEHPVELRCRTVITRCLQTAGQRGGCEQRECGADH